MNEPQEPRTLRAILDDIKGALAELERTLNGPENTIEELINPLVVQEESPLDPSAGEDAVIERLREMEERRE